MATNLVTAVQAQALLPGLAAAEAAALPSLIGPASRAVEAWCRQGLGFASYLEYHRPGPTRSIRLKNGFVVPGSVGLRADLASVATIACADPAALRATATLTAAKLTLASSATTVLALASYATVGALAAAIAATPGWSAAVNPGYAGWLVADLEPNPGAMGALHSAVQVQAFVRDLSCWAMDSPAIGLIELAEDRPQAFRYPDRTWGGPGFGYGGGLPGSGDARVANVRCAYQAGFDPDGILAPPTPDDLALGVAQTVRAMIDSGQFSGVIKSANLGNTTIEIGGTIAIPDSAKAYLSRYVRRSLG